MNRMIITDAREVFSKAADMIFTNCFGVSEICHATGEECMISGIWLNEFEDSEGSFHYAY